MATFLVVGFISKARNILLIPILRLSPKHRARRSKVRDKGIPIMQAAATSPRLSSTIPTPPSIVAQNGTASYYSLAQRLQKLLPPNLNVLGVGDVQITEAAPFSSGGFSDVWKASLQGRLVVVKSLRCYSSPEYDPAEVGIVSFHHFLRWLDDR